MPSFTAPPTAVPPIAAPTPAAPVTATPIAAPPTFAATAPAPAPAPATPATPATPVETQMEMTLGDSQESKPKRNTTFIDAAKIKMVIDNVKTKSYLELAEMTELTKHQVNRILQTLKTGMRQKAIDADPNAYGVKNNKNGEPKPDYTAPLTDLAKNIEAKITDRLCRPDTGNTGRAASGGKTKKSLDDALTNLLADL